MLVALEPYSVHRPWLVYWVEKPGGEGGGLRLGFRLFTDETQCYCMRARSNRYCVMATDCWFSARSGTEQSVCGGKTEATVFTVFKRPHSAGVQSRGVF